MQTQYATCPNCQTQNLSPGGGRCTSCGTVLPISPMPMQPYGGYSPQKPIGSDKKIAAGICAILLGSFGVHKFILGYKVEGIIMLSVWIVGLFLCGIPSLAINIVAIVEGVMYLTKTDEEFSNTYIMGKNPWF